MVEKIVDTALADYCAVEDARSLTDIADPFRGSLVRGTGLLQDHDEMEGGR